MGGLLGRAGLALPVADSDRLEVTYRDMFRLMADLRAWANKMRCLVGRGCRPGGIFTRAAEIYATGSAALTAVLRPVSRL